MLTVLQRLRPVHERLSSLFTPDTLRRWHRELVRRKWDGPHRINKRKTIPLRTQLIGHGRPTRATSGSPAPPFAPRELSVPAKERLWRDEEGAPAPSRQQPGEGGEDRPIHRAIGDARIELALEDAHLVAEHHDLDVLVRLGPPRGSEQAEDPAQAEVTEGEGHGRSWSLAANTASSGQRSRFWCSTPICTRPLVSTGDHDYPQFHARSRTDRARPICVYGRILPCPSLPAGPSSSISTAALRPAPCAHWPGSHHPRSARAAVASRHSP